MTISRTIAIAGPAAAETGRGASATPGTLALPSHGRAENRSSAWAISAPPANVFNTSLHGARGLLALLVFVFHIACSGVQSLPLQSAALPHAALISLQFGVEIFFCISGFIVVGALRRADNALAFITDRAIRILPVLWLTLAVIIPLGLLTHQSQFAGLNGRDLSWIIPLNLAALAGILPIPVLHMAAWSLSYELVFYVAAATFWWIPARRVALRAAVGVLCAALVVWHPRALFFAVGVLVARTDITRHPVLRHATRAPGLVLAAFLACWYEVQFGGGAQGDATILDWVQDGRLGLAAIAISLSIAAFSGIVAGHGLLGTMLRSAPLQWLGTVSYSFYLWHLIVIAIAKRGLVLSGIGAATGQWSQLLLLVLCLPASLAVSYASVRLIEQGLSGWIKRQRVALARPIGLSDATLAATT